MKMRKNWKRFWTLNRHHAAGFTLVELIVVIAILAILGGVAVPAYSGYVKKAELASDQQLLAAVNTAFASACLANGTEVHLIDSASINWGNDNKRTVKGAYVTAANDEYDQAFAGFYAGNENAEFKTSYGIAFDGLLHQFKLLSPGESISVSYGGGYIFVNADDLQTLNDSTFMTNMGSDVLLGKLALVSDLAAALNGLSGNSANLLTSVHRSPEFLAYAAHAMGISLTDESGADKSFDQLNAELAVALNRLTGGDSTKEGSIMANATILYASKEAAAMTSDQISTLFGNPDVKGSIIGNIEGNTAVALAQSTIAYGMFTAYANSDQCTDPTLKDLDPISSMSYLNHSGFQSYLSSEQGKQDMDAFMSSLNVINSSTDSKDAVSTLLGKGFSDSDLADALKQVLGK